MQLPILVHAEDLAPTQPPSVEYGFIYNPFTRSMEKGFTITTLLDSLSLTREQAIELAFTINGFLTVEEIDEENENAGLK